MGLRECVISTKARRGGHTHSFLTAKKPNQRNNFGGSMQHECRPTIRQGESEEAPMTNATAHGAMKGLAFLRKPPAPQKGLVVENRGKGDEKGGSAFP